MAQTAINRTKKVETILEMAKAGKPAHEIMIRSGSKNFLAVVKEIYYASCDQDVLIKVDGLNHATEQRVTKARQAGIKYLKSEGSPNPSDEAIIEAALAAYDEIIKAEEKKTAERQASRLTKERSKIMKALDGKTNEELKDVAKKNGVVGYSSMNKAGLLDAIATAQIVNAVSTQVTA